MACLEGHRCVMPTGLLLVSFHFQVGQYVGSRALSGLHRTVEVTLRIDRGVLAAEVAVVRPLVLRAGEAGVLPDTPVRVGASGPRIAGPVVPGDLAVPLL